ncbi:MAG: DUF3325 family protein [Comamonas sp.]
MFELLLCFAGWSGMALGMDRHHEDAWARAGSARRLRLLRRAGAALLVLSLLLAIGRPGALTVPFSLAWWFTAWSLAALASTAAATWQPRRLPLLGLLALAAALALWPRP